MVAGSTSEFCKICEKRTLHVLVEKSGVLVKFCQACVERRKYEELLVAD